MHNTFFTADLHFGHKNIIKYDQRPFFTVKEMDEQLIQRWNKKVKQNDSVYILGDVSFYPAKETTEILKRLNGSKTLIIGNHDKKLIRSKDVQNQFREVSHYIEIDVDTVTHGCVHTVLSHYYMPFYNGSFRGAVHLHGHTHNSKESDIEQVLKEYLKKDNYDMCAVNVGCMHWRYEPVTLDEILDSVNG